MNKIKINEKILDGIHENSGGDMIIENFLKELIFEEADHFAQWRWKEVYKKIVDKYSEHWEGNNEN
jgi:hypothetical protein